MTGMAQIFLWLWLGGLGFLVTRAVTRMRCPWTVVGSALPVSMLCLLGTAFPLARLLGHPRGWVLALVALVATAALLFSKRDRLNKESLEEFGFSPMQWACFMTLLTTAGLIMHTREVLGPEDDYWIHFPLISLLQRGDFPPPHPFFSDLVLHGHFGRDYLVGVLSWLSGGGLAQLSSTWIFNHTLQASAFFLAFGLGRRHGGTAGGFLMASFLFFGISVGSRVGLTDTYDNNNLLVYVLLLFFFALESCTENSRRADLFLGLGLGVYGIIYETHMLLFLLVLPLGPLLWRRKETLSPKDWLRPIALCLGSLLIAALLGGPIADLAKRPFLEKKSEVDHAATYSEQRVQVSFPKEKLFQILVGPEGYRRLSYVYQGKAFAALQKEAGQETDFHYASIFGPKVLLMHWLALYLGFPAGFWLIHKRASVGVLLWSFGLISYLVPALVDFGPVHEREYFRWEFAAGFGFAGALAVATALLWSRGGWRKPLVVILALAVTLGGERKVNRNFIEMSKLPPERAQLASSPFYPSPREWILGSKELRMSQGLLDASLALRDRSRPGDRMVTDLDSRSHWDLFQESTVAGLTGLRSVAHATPPPWMPDGISPYFRTAAWSQLWQTGDVRTLPFLESRWLMTSRKETAEKLKARVREDLLKEIESFEEVTLWRYLGPTDRKDKAIPEARLVGVEITDPQRLKGEVSSPMVLVLDGIPAETEVDLAVAWIPQEGTDPGGDIEPLTLRDRSPKGDKPWRFAHALVPPLVEGNYRLEVRLNGHLLPLDKALEPALEVKFDWTSLAQEAAAALNPETGEVAFSPGSPDLLPPLTVGMRLFRTDEQRYNKPFGFEAKGVWTGGATVQLESTEPSFSFPVSQGLRPDLFLLDRSGREVPLAPERS